MFNEILELAHKISLERKADVFINYSGHVQSIDYMIYINGWGDGDSPTYRGHIYIKSDIELFTKQLNELLQLLTAIYNEQILVTKIGECHLCSRNIYSNDKFVKIEKNKICTSCAESLKEKINE